MRQSPRRAIVADRQHIAYSPIGVVHQLDYFSLHEHPLDSPQQGQA